MSFIRRCWMALVWAFLATSALALSKFPVPGMTSTCDRIAVRRDIVTLSSTELERFVRVIREMHRRGWMDGFGSMHDHISHEIHGSEHFFMWHRRFIRHFELLMQQVDPDSVLPYWNWATHWQTPSEDPVLSSMYFGTNGRPIDGCVVDGAEARWGRNYPTRNCLTRRYRYGVNTGPFWPMSAVRDIINTAHTHADFRSRIENGAHGIVHLGLGGDFETMWAPVDVLFFLHHSMIDRIWAEWQSQDSRRLHSVDGLDYTHIPITLQSPMPYYGDPVGSSLVTTSAGYCYVYDDVPAPSADARLRAANIVRALNFTGSSFVDTAMMSKLEESNTNYTALVEEALVSIKSDTPDDVSPYRIAREEVIFANNGDSFELRAPEKISDRWIKNRNLNRTEVDRMDRFISDFIKKMNVENRKRIKT